MRGALYGEQGCGQSIRMDPGLRIAGMTDKKDGRMERLADARHFHPSRAKPAAS